MKFIKYGYKGMVIAAFIAGAMQSIIDFIEAVVVDKKNRWSQLTLDFVYNSACNLAGNFIGAKLNILMVIGSKQNILVRSLKNH